MQTIKALGALLLYPEEAIIEALDELQQVIEKESLLSPEQIAAVVHCIEDMRPKVLLDLQEEYVQLFDNSPKHALYLFQHLYGDSPDRGPAMADLIDMYREHGYQSVANELPDYLPLYCEFAAQFPEPEARALLGRALPVLELVAQRLEQKGSPYAAVLSALGSLAIADEETEAIAQLLKAQARTRSGKDEQTLDEAWQEQPVSFTAQGEQLNHPKGTAGTVVNVPIESVTYKQPRNQHVRN
jgi:nitrate reductase delta subunit